MNEQERTPEMNAQAFRAVFKAYQASEHYPKIVAAMEAENERFDRLGEGDDSWERIMLEVAKETFNGTDAVEDWPPEKIRAMTDAILRRRNPAPVVASVMLKLSDIQSIIENANHRRPAKETLKGMIGEPKQTKGKQKTGYWNWREIYPVLSQEYTGLPAEPKKTD